MRFFFSQIFFSSSRSVVCAVFRNYSSLLNFSVRGETAAIFVRRAFYFVVRLKLRIFRKMAMRIQFHKQKQFFFDVLQTNATFRAFFADFLIFRIFSENFFPLSRTLKHIHSNMASMPSQSRCTNFIRIHFPSGFLISSLPLYSGKLCRL